MATNNKRTRSTSPLMGAGNSSALNRHTVIDMPNQNQNHEHVAIDMPLGRNNTACMEMVRGIVAQLPRPEIEVSQEVIDHRIQMNLLILEEDGGYDSPEKIQEFIDLALSHDTNTVMAQSIAKNVPNGVVNFSAMHDATLFGNFAKDLTGDQLGWYLGTIIGAADIVTSVVVDGAFDKIPYHKTDILCLEKLVNPNFVSARDPAITIRSLGTEVAANFIKNSFRIPSAAIIGIVNPDNNLLVNTNNYPVLDKSTEKMVVNTGAAGIFDNTLDSFLPLIIQPIKEYVKMKQIAPVYAASLLLRPDLRDVIQRTRASWGQAFKQNLLNAPFGIGKKAYEAFWPTQKLIPNLMVIASIGLIVSNVVNTNGNLNSTARNQYVRDNPTSPFIKDGKLIDGLIPVGGWVNSRKNSLLSFAAMNIVATGVYHIADQIIAPPIRNALNFAWDKVSKGLASGVREVRNLVAVGARGNDNGIELQEVVVHRTPELPNLSAASRRPAGN